MRASATLYLRGGDLLLAPQSQTTTGLWILSPPVTRLDPDCSNEALGTAARAALSGSRTGVPHPRKFTGASPLYEVAKVKDFPTFVKGTRCVSLREDGGATTLIAMRNRGAREGFEELPSSAVSLADSATPEALGEALREALAKAT